MKKFLEIGAVITGVIIVVLSWFIGFINETYKANADVSNLKQDVLEIKADTRFIRNYLIEQSSRQNKSP